MSLRTTTARWRPALRMAWRDLRTHRLRSLAVIVLVALPIAAAVTISTIVSTTSYDSANSLYGEFGAADLALDVTPWPSVRVTLQDQGRYVDSKPIRGLTTGDRRVPGEVDVTSLLPAASTVMRTGSVSLPLTTGGSLAAEVLDLTSPLVLGLATLDQGRAPQDGDEVAVAAAVADELGLVDADGTLLPDAVLPLAEGPPLKVVGLSDTDDAYFGSLAVVSPASPFVGATTGDGLRGDVDTVPYLVGLPAMSTAEQQQLFDDLATVGVVATFRDAALHPEDWGAAAPLPSPVDPVAVAVGALVIGLGLVEVLVLVGAVFAVGARRQSRTLGLMIASGGTAADVRRTLLAQGVWIGLAAAMLGVGGGVVALLAGRNLWGSLVDTRLIEYDVSVGSIVALAVLGVASAVLAAAIPAWGVGRMTASQALDGHVALPKGAKRDRLRGPAIVVVSLGSAGLLASGFWVARAYADSAGSSSGLPVAVAALFALVVLVGTGLGIPSVISFSARSAGRGWLPWRLATRDATRNRARTTAAVYAIGVVTTGAVFAGFGASAATAYDDGGFRYLPPDTTEIYLDPAEYADTQTLARVESTIREVLGADTIGASTIAQLERSPVVAGRAGDVFIVNDDNLDLLQVSERDRTVLATGGALSMRSASNLSPIAAEPAGDQVRLRTRGPNASTVGVLDATTVELPWAGIFGTWISAETASDLGLTAVPTGYLLAHAPGITQADADRLSLYGLSAQIEYDGAPSQQIVYAGAAGTLALTALIVGMIVALSAAEGRSDAATLASIGAPPWTRRAMSAAHALYVGGLGSGIGLLLGAAVGATTLQVIGTSGTPVPWGALGVIVVGVPVLCAAVGWVVTPTRLSLTRRAG